LTSRNLPFVDVSTRRTDGPRFSPFQSLNFDRQVRRKLAGSRGLEAAAPEGPLYGVVWTKPLRGGFSCVSSVRKRCLAYIDKSWQKAHLQIFSGFSQLANCDVCLQPLTTGILGTWLRFSPQLALQKFTNVSIMFLEHLAHLQCLKLDSIRLWLASLGSSFGV